MGIVLAAASACSGPKFFSHRDRGSGGGEPGGAGSEAGENSGASAGAGLGGSGTGGTAGQQGGTNGIATGGTGTAGNGTSGGTAGAGSGGDGATAGGGGRREPVDVTIGVEDDEDDALWVDDSDERLIYSEANPYLEVGGDAEMARAGLRFRLPIPVGSTIESATLALTRQRGDASADETMNVQVFDSASVPPFDDDHEHGPEEHDPGGLFAQTVSGFAVGSDDDTVTSPELAALVAHVVERSDYEEGGVLGFVLSAGELGGWVQYADRAGGGGGVAELSVRYVPP